MAHNGRAYCRRAAALSARRQRQIRRFFLLLHRGRTGPGENGYAIMKFRTEVSVARDGFSLDAGDTVVTLGSCFAESVGARLAEYKFDCDINPFGTLYNPRSVCQALNSLTAGEPVVFDGCLFRSGGLWNSWMHSGRFSAAERSRCLENINLRYSRGRAMIREARALLITFGTSRCYCLADGAGTAVANCHKMPEARFLAQDMTAAHTASACKEALSALFGVNPGVQVLLTVSPYRYAKYGLHGSALSKASLLLAAEEVVRCFPGRCFYFPSYEIVNDELRDYRFYADDMLHISPLAADYIFERFAAYAFSGGMAAFAQEWEKIVKAMHHRPLHPEAEEYRVFIGKTLSQLDAVSRKYPGVDVADEIARLEERLGGGNGCHQTEGLWNTK